MDNNRRVSNDKGSPPPAPSDHQDSPPAPPTSSPPSPSPPSPPTSSPPAPSPPSPSPPSPPTSSPPAATLPSPSPPSPSPPAPTPPALKPDDPSSPPPPSQSTPPPSPRTSDPSSPPRKDSPLPSSPSPSPTPPTSPPAAGTPPATPGTPPLSPPLANPAPPGPVIPPPSDNGPPLQTTPPSGLGGDSSTAPNPPSMSTPSDIDSSQPTSSSPPSGSSTRFGTSPVVVGVVAAGALLLAFTVICLVCTKKKKRKQEEYYNRAGSQYKQANFDHVVKFPSGQLATGTPRSPNCGAWGTRSDSSTYNSGQHNTRNMQNTSSVGALGGYSSQSQFSYQDLAAATSGFSQENLLGQGGFGLVHKGVLANGQVVAVKSLKSGSGQGEREFQAEVEIISRVHHRHLVSLVGYCIADTQRMLVYEFVPNQTLEYHLHGQGVPVMDWASRMRIALGSAKGLAYLHEDCHPRIIHRDIKAANILLDENYEAMVADFGLAKLSSDNFTHVSTRVMGTFGYLAPEYASSGKLSEKSDVFSFGVMLLELVTGQRPVDPTGQMEDSLVDWSRPLMTKALEDGNYDEIADPRLEGTYIPDEMAHMIACASASVRHSSKRRPRMSQIVRSLEGDLAIDDMSVAVKNTLTNTTSGISTATTNYDSTYDTGAYNADMMKFRKMVLNPQEAPLTTAEFALDPTPTVSGALDPNFTISGPLDPTPTCSDALDPNFTISGPMDPTCPVSGEYMHKK